MFASPFKALVASPMLRMASVRIFQFQPLHVPPCVPSQWRLVYVGAV